MMIASDLKQAIPSTVCNGVDAFLNGNINSFIATSIAAGLPLTTTIRVDISAYGPPSVTPGSLQIGLNGKCYPVNNPGVSYSFPRTPLPSFTNSNGMLKMMAGEYATNTLLHSMHANGLLALSPRQVLTTLGTPVTTATLSWVIPGFFAYGTKPMLFMLSVLNPPNATITESDVAIAGILELTMLVNNTGTLEEALVMDADSILHGTASASGTTVQAQITSVEYTLSIKRSAVGTVNLPGFKALLDIVVQSQLISTLNNVIFPGFEIPPIYGLRYTNLGISMLQGAMEISGNVEGAFEN
ncbi:BPI fold-containing family C protein-like [Ciona intestinalis]